MWEADRLEVLVLVENWVDMLLPEDHTHCVSRFGLIEHFDPKLVPPQAENGISLLVRAERMGHTQTVLFDVGLTGQVLLHNLASFDVDPWSIDHVVISHGHPDHYGGISALLDELPRSVPVATHPDAFLPRYAVMGDGRSSPFYNHSFSTDELGSRGGRPVLTKDPLDLGSGIFTTGEIPRTVDFERPSVPDGFEPGLYQVGEDGAWRPDEVRDEHALVINVRDEGLVVLTGCAHAGVVNTILRAQEIAEEQRIRAVMGGFHLGFPTTPRENVNQTVRSLERLDVRTIMPMHCSGLAAHAAFSAGLQERYVQPSVGSVLRFGR